MKRLALAFALVAAAVFPFAADAAPLSGSSAYWELELGGAATGPAARVSPLGYSRVVDGQVVATATPRPVDVDLGFGHRKQLEWVAAFFAGNSTARALELGEVDYDFKLLHRYEIPDFAISRVQVPACSGDGDEPAYLRVRGRGSRVTRIAASGEATDVGKVVPWVPRDFRVKATNLEASKVSFIGPIDVERGPQGVVIAPFEIVTSSKYSDDWYAWAEKVLVRGETDERTIEIELLTKDHLKVLATIRLTGVSPIEMDYTNAAPGIPFGRSSFRVTAKGIALTFPKAPKVKKPPKG